MRATIYATFLLAASATVVAAFAEPHERPAAPPPEARASLVEREQWCERYANWYLSRLPVSAAQAPEMRPTQRYETEFNSCTLNPREYERDTVAELVRWGEPVTARG